MSDNSSNLKYKRVLLKVSGEGLAAPGAMGVDAESIIQTARMIKQVHDQGVQLAVVVGGGNLIRGAQIKIPQINRATADYMGMLATVMNALALQDTCESIGLQTRVQSSITMNRICEQWIRRRAIRHMEKGRVVILAGGTGNPHFTTDTASAQRAIELECDIVIKATQVDGVYDKDPKKHADAKRFDTISYQEVLARDLRVMDGTAIALCREHKLPIMVLNIEDRESLIGALRGEKTGTLVCE